MSEVAPRFHVTCVPFTARFSSKDISLFMSLILRGTYIPIKATGARKALPEVVFYVQMNGCHCACINPLEIP